jgi:hypothetical protein
MNHISVCSNEPLKSSKMRTSAARILVLTLTMAVLGMSVSCGNSVSSDVKNSVIDDALAVAEAKTPPERWDSVSGLWVLSMQIFGVVTSVESQSDVYRLSFPVDPEDSSRGWEVWEVSYDPDVFVPVNVPAFISALFIFCGSADNLTDECQILLDGLEKARNSS